MISQYKNLNLPLMTNAFDAEINANEFFYYHAGSPEDSL